MGAPISATEPFADTVLLSAYLRVGINPGDRIAELALAAATSAIQSYCDQLLGRVVDDVVDLDGSGTDTVLLPEYPVINVSRVIVDADLSAPTRHELLGPSNGDSSEYDFNEAGLLVRRRGNFILWEDRFNAAFGRWPDRRKSILVTYTHGYDPIPAELQLICVTVAARAYAQDGATTESTGQYTAAYASQPGVLSADEKRILDRYRSRRH